MKTLKKQNLLSTGGGVRLSSLRLIDFNQYSTYNERSVD